MLELQGDATLGIESLQKRQTFGLEELGLLDTAPLKTLDLIASLTAEALGVPIVALMVFDDQRGSLFLRSIAGETTARPGTLAITAAQCASVLVRNEGSVISIASLGFRQDTRTAVERQIFGATGFLAAPILGPASDIVAVLAAMTPEENYWSRHQRKLISNFAYLACKQIMLRAALHTVKLMGQERDSFGPISNYRN